MIIYGAGLAGLLAAHMLRRHKPIVCEAQPSLPNNHDALLRFRTDTVSKAVGIPFKKVVVSKGIVAGDAFFKTPQLDFSNMYSRKVTGQVIGRSIMNLDPVERYIAPPDLIAQLADGLDIKYNTRLDYLANTAPIISTIPMPALMTAARWEGKPLFNFRTITTVTADIVNPVTDVYQTIYYPSPTDLQYRASITGNRLIIEMVGEQRCRITANLIASVLVDFGIGEDYTYNPDMFAKGYEVKEQGYGKIAPIDEAARKQFILAMSDQFNCYSVGRYATWRNILLDDVVHDIQVVEKFINERDGYKKKIALASN